MSSRLFTGVLIAGAGLAFTAAASPMPQSGTAARTDEVIAINGVDQRQTIPCNGRRVAISGSGNVIQLTGVCASLDLNGVDNRVTLTVAPNGTLSVAGTGQVVRWSSTGRPRVNSQGVDNQITRVQ
ncbi:MAG: DUF3060 domain-containing protein [Brevundimonas sp.]